MQVVDNLGKWLKDNSYSIADVAFPATVVPGATIWSPGMSIDELQRKHRDSLHATPASNAFTSDSAVMLKRAHRQIMQRTYSDQNGFNSDMIFLDMLNDEPERRLEGLAHTYILLEGRVYVDPDSLLCKLDVRNMEREEIKYATLREVVVSSFLERFEKEESNGLRIYGAPELALTGELWGLQFVPVFGYESFVMNTEGFSGFREIGDEITKSVVGRLVSAVHDSGVKGVMELPFLDALISPVKFDKQHGSYLPDFSIAVENDKLHRYQQLMITYYFAATGVKKIA
jgi:hypothetical protein